MMRQPETSAGRRRLLYEEAVEVMRRRYADDALTVTGVSQNIFSSRRQLQRSFAEAGTSVRETLHAIRMERAAEMLAHSDLPVADIGRRVGYRQPAQFAKAFRRYYGMPPSGWREQRERQLGAAA
jgi:AraC-like DNA-binding protein